MRIHSFHHVPFEGLGIIERWIKEKRHTLTSTNFYENYSFPPLDSFDLLIIMGGPMSVYEEDKYRWLKEEKEFIKKSINAGKKVLGICLGSQLIANSLGAEVHKNIHKEIGWYPLILTGKGKEDYFLGTIPDKQTVLHWHGDTFEIPDGAVPLAESEATKNQAFVYKDNVFALQFHMEFTEESLQALIDNVKEEPAKDKYVQTPKEIFGKIELLKDLNKIIMRALDKLEERI